MKKVILQITSRSICDGMEKKMKYITVQEYLKKTFDNVSDKKTAIENENQQITYGQLKTAVSCICQELNNKTEMPGSHIGICVEDKSLMVAAMIAVIQMRHVAVPFDTTFPAERIAQLQRIADVTCVITDKEFMEQKSILVSKSIFFESHCMDYQSQPAFADDPVYIYFTSGSSTGQPKAVVGKNCSLAHFIDWEISEFHIESGVRVSQLTPPIHDPYLRDIFIPLFTGGTICIPQKEVLLSPPRLTIWIDNSSINLIHCTPSVFEMIGLSEISTDLFESLKYVFIAGERLYSSSVRQWKEKVKQNVQLINLYGPTETTLAKLYHVIKEEDLSEAQIPIGKPIKGADFLLLNEAGEICNVGEIGEIYLSTKYRTLGYYNNNELNAKSFFSHPLINDEIVYKTGDLAQMRGDRSLIFVRRIDDQYKIRGHQVSLSDIEIELVQYPGVNSCAVCIQENEKNSKLFAFYISDVNVSVSAMREFAIKKVPDYMCPHEFVKIDAMPMTINGKIDRNKLLELRDNHNVEQTKVEDERIAKLQQIWSELLNKKDISIDDSFMEVGGDSLSMMQLIARVNTEFNYEIPIWQVFNKLTIRKLDEAIKNALT